MKKVLLLLTSLCMSIFLDGQACSPNDITLTTQAEVVALGASDCTEIIGNLRIQSIASGDVINDLSPLQNLTSIGGYLQFSNNSSLNNIDGLQNLTSIGGFLRFQTNNSLSNVDGLQNLTSIGGYLWISGNSSLSNVDALQNLTSISEWIIISFNSSLSNVDGLQNLTSIGGYLLIQNNSSLSNVDGLQNLTSIGEILAVENNSSLSEFCGLNTLLTEPNNGGTTGIAISGNLNNPTETEIEEGGACSRILPAPSEDLPLMPMPYLILLMVSVLGVLLIGVKRMRIA